MLIIFISCDWCEGYKRLTVKKDGSFDEEIQGNRTPRTFCIILRFLRTLPRRHPSTKPSGVFPLGENMSDMDGLLLCATTCVKVDRRTMSGPDIPDVVWSSHEKSSNENCALSTTPSHLASKTVARFK